MQNKDDWMQTFSGRMFRPFDPRPEDIHLIDLAHHLSALNRFTGAAIAPYSVAQHSVLGSRQFTNRNLAAWFLLHDGSEAYTNDLSARLKPSFPKFKEMETRILRCLVKKFNLSWPMPAEVKRMDLVMLLTEKRDLMAPEPMDWNLPVLEPLREKIYPWSFVRSKSEFLTRFNELFPRV